MTDEDSTRISAALAELALELGVPLEADTRRSLTFAVAEAFGLTDRLLGYEYEGATYCAACGDNIGLGHRAKIIDEACFSITSVDDLDDPKEVCNGCGLYVATGEDPEDDDDNEPPYGSDEPDCATLADARRARRLLAEQPDLRTQDKQAQARHDLSDALAERAELEGDVW